MAIDEFNTIIEGCMPDTPRKLMYTEIEQVIPENANILFWDHEYHPLRYLLYARNMDNIDIEIVNNPFYQSRVGFDANKEIKGGIPLKEYIPNFNWIFDSQRSIITKDNRIYVNATYFENDWRWYLEAVPLIFKECNQIFSGEVSSGYFYEKPSSAW